MKAYPIMYKHPTTGLIVEEQGMELRDWFAGMAMQAWITATTKTYHHNNELMIEAGHESSLAKNSYKVADALIKARENKDD